MVNTMGLWVAQICHCSANPAVNNMQMTRSSLSSIKLYWQKYQSMSCSSPAHVLYALKIVFGNGNKMISRNLQTNS